MNVAHGTVGHVLFTAEDKLGFTATKQNSHAGFTPLAGAGITVTIRQVHGQAKRTATRHYGHLVQGIIVHIQTNKCMASFVVRRVAAFFFGHDHGFALCAHHDLVFGIFKFSLCDDALVAASGKQCSFVAQVGQISTGEAGRTAGQNLGIDIRCQWLVLHMDLENLLTALHVGVANLNLAVKTARTQQRWIKHVRTVGCGDDDDAFIGFKTIHFHKQLVQCLLTFIVAAAEAGTTVATDSVDFVDEDDARCAFLGLLEHVAHAACTDAYEHFNKVGTRDREEGNIGFASDCASQQGFTGTWRTDQQCTTGDLAAETLELVWIFEEVDNFNNVILGFVNTCYISKGDLALLFGEQFRARFAEAHGFASAALHLAHDEEPHADDQKHRQPVNEHVGQERVALCGLEYSFNVL